MNLKKMWEGLKEKKQKEYPDPIYLFQGSTHVVSFVPEVREEIRELDKAYGEHFNLPMPQIKEGPATCILIRDEEAPMGIIALMLYGDHRVALSMIAHDLEALKKYFEDHLSEASPVCAKRWELYKTEEPAKQTSIGFVQDFKQAA